MDLVMHSYSVDTQERVRVIIILALLGVGLAYCIHLVEGLIGFGPPWWFDAPAAYGLAIILYVLFDRFLWRWGILRRLGIVSTPNFGGEWLGSIQSSHDDHRAEVPATMRIKQTWTTVLVVLETNSSRSESQTAGISTDPGALELTHTYLNQPKSGSAPSMQIHLGTAVLRLDDSGKALTGDYYSGRGRLTEGRLSFNRAD